MQLFHLVLVSVLVASIGWALITGHRNRKRKKLNDLIANELDFIIRDVISSIKKTKKSATSLGEGLPDIGSPEMLSTLVTVLVNKVGTVNLSLADFAGVPDDEYVSVYVDGDSKEIILSMNHRLGEAEPYVVGFGDSDDSTFH